MKKSKQRLLATFASSILAGFSCMPLLYAATPPPIAGPAGLSIVELKVTGDEFLLLQNNSDAPLDISNYWLTSYNNVDPLTPGVSSSSQQLPSVIILAGQTLLLSASPMQTCGASVAGKLSLSLTDAGGFLQLASSAISETGMISQSPSDYVSWSSSNNGVIKNVPSSTKAPRAAYYRYSKGFGFAWQQADLDTLDGCQLNIVVAGGSSSSSAVTPLTLAATSPPATILGLVESVDGAAIAVLPLADIGLIAPQISELLPNPVGTGNDSTDEFIELYNPNTKPFDLTGFTLQTGMTSFKTYEFPEATMLAPGAFKAFSASDTKLALSNTTSQAALLDPFGNIIASSEPYKNAKDGIGWVSAKGKWLWTTKLTPGAANVVQQPAIKKSSKTATKKKTANPTVEGVSTVNSSSAPNANGIHEEEQATVVHYGVLALVGGVALLYGIYEYRRDLINRMQQLGRKLGVRRTPWSKSSGSGSD